MKTLFTFFFVITIFQLRAQSSADTTAIVDPDAIYNVVDVAPEPIGGMATFFQSTLKNIKYPKDARMKNITGKVIVQFVVEKNGEILSENLKVVRSVYESLDEEARRMVLLTSPWHPGTKNGQPVRTRKALPVTFNLAPLASPTK